MWSVYSGKQHPVLAYRASRTAGFTLLELMITLAIAALLIGLAAPSFTNMIKGNQIAAARASISAGIKGARGEAVERKQPVSICPSTDQSTCGGNWNDGWIVFVDTDGNGSRGGGTELLIDVHYGYGNGVRTGAGGGSAFINFGANGLKLAPAGVVTVGICDQDTSSALEGKAVTVSATGSTSHKGSASAGC